MRRATLMGSNYLIRTEALNSIREIYKKYTPDKKKIIENLKEERIIDYQKQLARLNDEINRINDRLSSIKLELSNYENNLKIEYSLQFDEKNRIEELKLAVSDLAKLITDNEIKIAYITQALNNIGYKEASLNEFSYFFVALIKELTLNNDSKVLILDKNLKEINPAIDKSRESDFFFLVQLIQFEMVSLIHQGLKIIVNNYFPKQMHVREKEGTAICFSRKCSENEVEEEMKNSIKLALTDYRLASFKTLLEIKDYEHWSKTQDFPVYLHLLYLISALQKEEINPCNISLEEKIKAIIQNIYRMVAYPNFNTKRDTYKEDLKTGKNIRDYKLDGISLGGFLSIRHKGDKIEKTYPEDIIIAQATSEHTKPTGPSLMKVEVDKESLSYYLLNGISSRNSAIANEQVDTHGSLIYNEYPLKPWTILELEFKTEGDQNYWHSPRGNFFPVNAEVEDTFDKILFNKQEGKIKYGFTENLNIKGEPRQMIFFRIADIFEEDGKIKNIGQALICLFNEEQKFDINRVRLLLILRTYLLTFIKTHFDNDSLTAFVKEKIKLKEAEKLKHGYLYYLNGLHSLAEGNNDFLDDQATRKEISKLYLDLVKSGPLLYTFFSELEYRKSKGEIFNNRFWEDSLMPLVEFSAESLVLKFEKMIKMILGSTNISNIQPIEIENPQRFMFHRPNIETITKTVFFPETLIDIIFAELLINAKKNFPGDNAKLFLEFNPMTDNTFEISVLNNFRNKLPQKTLLRINKNNVKYNTNGLGLIKRITGLLSDKYAEIRQERNVKFDEELFQVSITLKNLQNG